MIWLIGGTSDAESIGRLLLAAGAGVVVTTATQLGKVQMDVTGIPCIAMPMDCVEMVGFIMVRSIDMIIDASHPFAAEVSKNAIAASKQCGIPYIRYERSSIKAHDRKSRCDDGIIWAESCEEAAAIAACLGWGRVLVTTGSKTLPKVAMILKAAGRPMLARVLPEISSLETCIDAGLGIREIMCAVGPFSTEFEMELMKTAGIGVVMTKDSGSQGGADTKAEAAKLLGIPVVAVARPAISYPVLFEDKKELMVYLIKEGFVNGCGDLGSTGDREAQHGNYRLIPRRLAAQGC